MALATTTQVRELGGLPTAVTDSKITPQQGPACRELTRWVGDYSSATGTMLADCIEAEICLTMYYLLPVLNTFFTQGVSTLQKEIGEMDFLFHNPDDMEKVRDMWLDRARGAVSDYMGQDSSGRPSIGFYAI